MSGMNDPNKPVKSSGQKILFIVLALGFLLRIYISWFTSLPHLHRDSQEYFKQAEALLDGGYINFFPNGYPFMIALAKLLAGSAAVTVLVWANIFMSTIMIWFCYRIGKKIFQREAVALLAAGLLAVFPSQINYTRWLITEIPCEFFLLGAYYFYYHKKKILSGLFFGLAIVVRTELLSILLLLLILDIVWWKRIPVALCIGALVPMLLAGGYCYSKTGAFSLAGNGRINMLISVTASGSRIDWNIDEKYPEVNTSGKALKMYFDVLRVSPGVFIRNRLSNLWELWGFFPSSADGSRGLGSRLVIGAGNLLLLFFGLWGGWQNRKNKDALLLLLPFLVITGIHIFLFAMQRYTCPVEPFMILLAAASLVSFLRLRDPA
jgi:hypothetical protein